MISIKNLIKVKVSLCLPKHHVMKTYWGVEVSLDAVSDLGTKWRQVVSFTPRLLYPQGKSRRDPLDRRMGKAQNWSGHGVEEKISQPLSGIEPRSSDRPARSQSLYRVSYTDSIKNLIQVILFQKHGDDTNKSE
jgi:hypothetical protein